MRNEKATTENQCRIDEILRDGLQVERPIGLHYSN